MKHHVRQERNGSGGALPIAQRLNVYGCNGGTPRETATIHTHPCLETQVRRASVTRFQSGFQQVTLVLHCHPQHSIHIRVHIDTRPAPVGVQSRWRTYPHAYACPSPWPNDRALSSQAVEFFHPQLCSRSSTRSRLQHLCRCKDDDDSVFIRPSESGTTIWILLLVPLRSLSVCSRARLRPPIAL